MGREREKGGRGEGREKKRKVRPRDGSLETPQTKETQII